MLGLEVKAGIAVQSLSIWNLPEGGGPFAEVYTKGDTHHWTRARVSELREWELLYTGHSTESSERSAHAEKAQCET